MSVAPAIETRQLRKVYPGGTVAVDALDLRVESGEIFGLLGPNGAGKSTTAGMLGTKVVPTSGQALVAGVDVQAHPALVKRQIGVVSQANTLDRSLSVWENLYFHGRYFGMSGAAARSEAERLLEWFRLTDRASASVHALSGGMAQRLMIARAVMHRPTVVFLDEPTAGLDPQSRIALWEIMRELHADGQTILLTTHHMDEAEQLCERVAIIDGGRIVAQGTPDELKASVEADMTVAMTVQGDLSRLADTLSTELVLSRQPSLVDRRMHLVVPELAGVVPLVLKWADELGCVVDDLSVQRTTLETVFIHLTGKELRE